MTEKPKIEMEEEEEAAVEEAAPPSASPSEEAKPNAKDETPLQQQQEQMGAASSPSTANGGDSSGGPSSPDSTLTSRSRASSVKAFVSQFDEKAKTSASGSDNCISASAATTSQHMAGKARGTESAADLRKELAEAKRAAAVAKAEAAALRRECDALAAGAAEVGGAVYKSNPVDP